MKTRLLFFLLTILSQSFLFAQKSIWSKADESRISLSQYMERRTIPEKYDVWAVDFNTLKNTLDQAPLEFSGQMPLSFDMPLPEQGLVRFFVQHSPVYAPELAAKYPTFKTFIAETADKKYWARLDYTLHGFHAMISTPRAKSISILMRLIKQRITSPILQQIISAKTILSKCLVVLIK